MDDAPPRLRKTISPWLAVLPAFLISMGSITWSIMRFGGVQPALGILPARQSSAQGCAKVYGLETHYSEYYVRESSPGSGLAARNAPRELSTVLSGMVENTCAGRIDSVRIAIRVRNDQGLGRNSEVTVHRIEPGEAKRFEKAWIGRIESYEIASVR